MNGQDVHGLAAAYAVDAVDDEERAAFAAHLSACEACQREVAELADAAAGLSHGLQVEPPPELRDRVLRLVAAEAAERQGPARETEPRGDADGSVVSLDSARGRRRGTGRRRGWLVAAAAAVVVGVGAWGVSQTLTPHPVDHVINAEDAREHRSPDTPGLTLITSASADQAVLQLPEDLSEPTPGSVLQAWFISADGEARSAGVLDDDALEDRAVLLEGSVSGAAVVGLTLEPDGGSPQPTSDPVAAVPLES